MADPFSTVCDHCNATLKLKNPDLIGKKVKCPKCGEAFVVTGAAPAKKPPAKTKGTDDDDFMDFDAGDYASLPDDDDLDDEEGRPARRPRPSKGARKKGKKSSKGKGNIAQVVTIVAMVLIGIGVLGGGGYALMVLAKYAANDLDWLPSDIEGFAKIQPSQIWNSAALQPLTSGDGGKKFVDEMIKNIGQGPLEIDQIVIGFPKRGKVASECVVFRSRLPFDLSKLQGSAGNAQSASHAGRQYLKNDKITLFLADSKTLVCGQEVVIQELISRGKQNPSASKFGFASGYRDHVVVALADRSSPSPSVGSGGVMGMNLSPLQNAENLLIRGNASSDVSLSLLTTYKTADAAKGIVDKTQSDLNQGKTLLAQQKAQIQAIPADALVTMSGAMKIFDGIEQVMNSLKISQSGTRMSMEMNVPGQVIKDMTNMSLSTPFAQTPALGEFPSLFGN